MREFVVVTFFPYIVYCTLLRIVKTPGRCIDTTFVILYKKKKMLKRDDRKGCIMGRNCGRTQNILDEL